MGESDLLDRYERGSAWVRAMVPKAVGMLDAPTPCSKWDVRTMLNHMIDTQRFFLARARGEEGSLPASPPPALLSDDPVSDFAEVRTAMLSAFGQPGVIEKTGQALATAFNDLLIHGWDLATATGQDATMPAGLAEAAYENLHGRFTEEQRQGLFQPERPVPADASPQARLLAYTGRDPEQ
ncbi:MAG: TIGR03086 family protein [Chloroflexi bacterium]|nr:TIGR03086 family protein [Chloroflexota bacterium]